ncbi:MAG: site-specific integrase [Sideroxydans sp.]|jgi:integrase
MAKTGNMKKVEKNIYQIGKYSFQVKMMVAGQKISKVWDTLDEARTFRDSHSVSASLDVHESAIFVSRNKKRAAKNFTLADAIEDYREKKPSKKKGWQAEGSRLNLLLRLPIANEPLYMIHRNSLLACEKGLRSGTGQRVKGVKPKPVADATVKRYFNLLRHIFQVAKDEWKKVDSNPFDELAASERPKDGKPRDRRFEGDEYKKLLKTLSGEARVALVLFVEAAPRKGELLNFEWEHVKFKGPIGSVHIPETKTDEARTIPLSSVACKELKTLMPGKIKPKAGKVFKIGKDALRYQWRKAREAIGSTDLRIHDLRHEATSRLFEDKKFNVMEAASVTGHADLRSLKRYTHLNPMSLVLNCTEN